MIKENVKFEAPVGRLLIQAFREEANWFEREARDAGSEREYNAKLKKASMCRRLADRMDMSSRQKR